MLPSFSFFAYNCCTSPACSCLAGEVGLSGPRLVKRVQNFSPAEVEILEKLSINKLIVAIFINFAENWLKFLLLKFFKNEQMPILVKLLP